MKAARDRRLGTDAARPAGRFEQTSSFSPAKRHGSASSLIGVFAHD
jgi:hypothetical protein